MHSCPQNPSDADPAGLAALGPDLARLAVAAAGPLSKPGALHGGGGGGPGEPPPTESQVLASTLRRRRLLGAMLAALGLLVVLHQLAEDCRGVATAAKPAAAFWRHGDAPEQPEREPDGECGDNTDGEHAGSGEPQPWSEAYERWVEERWDTCLYKLEPFDYTLLADPEERTHIAWAWSIGFFETDPDTGVSSDPTHGQHRWLGHGAGQTLVTRDGGASFQLCDGEVEIVAGALRYEPFEHCAPASTALGFAVGVETMDTLVDLAYADYYRELDGCDYGCEDAVFAAPPWVQEDGEHELRRRAQRLFTNGRYWTDAAIHPVDWRV